MSNCLDSSTELGCMALCTLPHLPCVSSQQLSWLNGTTACSPAVGRPLTHAQLSHLTVLGLVRHLTDAFHHLLALNISSALGLRLEPVGYPEPSNRSFSA